MKTCTKCLVERDDGMFSARPNGKLQSHCKVCAAARSAAWHKANPDRNRAAVKRYLAANKAERAERSRKFNELHPDKVKAANAKWASSNRDRKRELSREWGRNNPAMARANEAARKAAKLQAIPPWHDPAQAAAVYAEAARLRAAGVDVHVDHVVPLRGRNVSGLHVHTNLQILPAKENIRKGNTFPVGTCTYLHLAHLHSPHVEP